MDKIKTYARATKNFVVTHKAAIAMGAVAVGAIALQQHNRVEFYEFLESKGIDPVEFYAPEFYEETQS